MRPLQSMIYKIIFILLLSISFEYGYAAEYTVLDEVFENCFSGENKEEIVVTKLLGGHSNTCLLLEFDGRKHVLRIKDPATQQKALQREIYAMQEAASRGIAPQIQYISKDQTAILMEYIEGGTASLEQVKQPESCSKIAYSFRKAHAIPKNPYFEEDSNEAAAAVCQDLIGFPGFKKNLDEALELMWKLSARLQTYEYSKVCIHGELNPRNMFLMDDRAVFIDWEYAGWEDPFSDLCYFALRVNYTEKEEEMFLSYYLQREPTDSELERYSLVKKMNFAQLCIYFHYFSLKFNEDKVEMDDHSPVRELPYYMNLFSDNQMDYSALAQYYYDLAKCCLYLAR